MKILIVSNHFYPDFEGGAEKVARRVAEWLSETHDVVVLTIGDKALEKNESEKYDVVRVPYHNIYPYHIGQSTEPALKKLLWHMRNATGGVSIRDLKRVLSEQKPDIVYMHNAMAFLPQLANLCRSRQLPVCAHLHDYALLCPKTSMYKHEKNCVKQCLLCRILTTPARRAMRSTSQFIAVSDFVRTRHISYGLCKDARWHVLHNAETDCNYVPLCHRAPIEDGPITIGYIGRLAPTKGLSDLVDAYLALPAGHAHLVIAGIGNDDYVRPLKRRTEGHAVKWLGHVDPQVFYEEIDCLVVSSRWHEPQGLVVVEAINRGIPIIASRRGGNTEMVEGYQSGVLYDPDKPKDLLNHLTYMCQQSRAEWRKSTPEIYPGLTKGNMVTIDKSNYFERLESILLFCSIHND